MILIFKRKKCFKKDKVLFLLSSFHKRKKGVRDVEDAASHEPLKDGEEFGVGGANVDAGDPTIERGGVGEHGDKGEVGGKTREGGQAKGVGLAGWGLGGGRVVVEAREGGDDAQLLGKG